MSTPLGVDNLVSRLVRAVAECKRAQELLGEGEGVERESFPHSSATQRDDEQDVHEAWACLQRARVLLEGHCPPQSAASKRLNFVVVELERMGQWLKSDPYTALACPPDASTKEVKKAYRKLVRRYHPDKSRSTDTRELFHIVQEAYEVLVDKKRRQDYDNKVRAAADARRAASKQPTSQSQQGRATSHKIKELSQLSVESLRTRLRSIESKISQWQNIAPGNLPPDTRSRLQSALKEQKLILTIMRQKSRFATSTDQSTKQGHREVPNTSKKASHHGEKGQQSRTTIGADTSKRPQKSGGKILQLKELGHANLLSDISAVDCLPVRQLRACVRILSNDPDSPQGETSYGMEKSEFVILLKTLVLDAMSEQDLRNAAAQVTSLLPSEIKEMGVIPLRKICTARVCRGIKGNLSQSREPDKVTLANGSKQSQPVESNTSKLNEKGDVVPNIGTLRASFREMNLLGKFGKQEVHSLLSEKQSQEPTKVESKPSTKGSQTTSPPSELDAERDQNVDGGLFWGTPQPQSGVDPISSRAGSRDGDSRVESNEPVGADSEGSQVEHPPLSHFWGHTSPRDESSDIEDEVVTDESDIPEELETHANDLSHDEDDILTGSSSESDYSFAASDGVNSADRTPPPSMFWGPVDST